MATIRVKEAFGVFKKAIENGSPLILTLSTYDPQIESVVIYETAQSCGDESDKKIQRVTQMYIRSLEEQVNSYRELDIKSLAGEIRN